MTDLFIKAWLNLAAKCWRSQLVTLVYHRVLERPDPMYPFDLTVEQFDAHMSWVARTFNVLSVRDAVAGLKANRLPPRALCITFDDGYLNTLTRAAPILQRYDLPATVFVCTSCLDCGILWNDEITEGLRVAIPQHLDLTEFELGVYELRENNRAEIAGCIVAAAKHLMFENRAALAKRLYSLCDRTVSDPMLDASHIRTLHRRGIEIGCHTHRHPILSRIGLDVARDDIRQSKALLEGIIESSVDYFAYPNGHPLTDYTQLHVDIVRESGFEAAFTADPGAAYVTDDMYQLPRFAPWDHQRLKYLMHLGINYFKRPVLTPSML